MRFDDSLATVLAVDTGSGAGARWRQLVDLTGRRRVPDIVAAIAHLRELRDAVPVPVRAASGRALAWGEPPFALVAMFGEDVSAVAAPVLRTAKLAVAEWKELLPCLSPATRSVLRHRRDLPDAVVRALATFGTTDFVLGHAQPMPEAEPVLRSEPAPEAAAQPVQTNVPSVVAGRIARALPVAAKTLGHAVDPPEFDIANIVARIDAFRRDHSSAVPAPRPDPMPEQWQFETDAQGVIRWVEGVARGPLIGATLTHGGRQGLIQVDSSIGAALRTRDSFRDVRLDVSGDSSAAGIWRLAGVSRFDRATGRFVGLAGIARRPRSEKAAAPTAPTSDSLRQLVHELRTPANAIAGFAELIGTELLGPVPTVYRDRAQLIQVETAGLIGAIEDIDTAARIESGALDLRPLTLDFTPVLLRVVADLQPFAAQRQATLVTDARETALVRADDRAVMRLLHRLFTTVLAVAGPGEHLRARMAVKTRSVRLHVTRPHALDVVAADLPLTTDKMGEGGPLLGVGFTLRLVRDLAAALGGSLAITPDRLTLRLPIAGTEEMGRARA